VMYSKSNGFKLKEGRFRLDIRKKFFTMMVGGTETGWPEKLWMHFLFVLFPTVWLESFYLICI